MADEIPHRVARINEYWDRISKVLICFVDAGLNYYFLRVVQQRLVDQYGLKKYAPLVKFNARLMCISVLLDVGQPYFTNSLVEECSRTSANANRSSSSA